MKNRKMMLMPPLRAAKLRAGACVACSAEGSVGPVSCHSLVALLLFWSYFNFIFFIPCLFLNLAWCMAPRKCLTNMSNERINMREGKRDFIASPWPARPCCPPLLSPPLLLSPPARSALVTLLPEHTIHCPILWALHSLFLLFGKRLP